MYSVPFNLIFESDSSNRDCPLMSMHPFEDTVVTTLAFTFLIVFDWFDIINITQFVSVRTDSPSSVAMSHFIIKRKTRGNGVSSNIFKGVLL